MTSITSRGSLKVKLEGRGLVTLRPSDHIATGGEGSIYRVGSDIAAKIYTDSKKMIKSGLAQKIQELAKIKSPYIVAPVGLIFSEKNDPIGYHMPFTEGHPLSRVFTNDFWNREGFTVKHARELVARMRDTVEFAHNCGAVLVDANELNWFAKLDAANVEPRVVDVDSWAIGKWGAAAIMPSIRDWSRSTFDEKSDWFSWGVVTFQVFTGLHPYKGTHPSFKKTDFVERMKANASVFSPDVRLNQAVRDFSLIPKPLLAWYEGVFQKGERSIPPSPLVTGANIPIHARTLRAIGIGKTGALVFEKLFSRTNDPVVKVFQSGAALLASGTLVNVQNKTEIGQVSTRDCAVARTPDGWLVMERDAGKAIFRYAETGSTKMEKLSFSPEARGLLYSKDRLFVLGEGGLTEIRLHTFGGKVLASAGQTWGALPNSTQIFEGACVQDAMGAKFLMLPTGEKGLVQIRVRELDGLKVISGKADDRFACFTCVDRAGMYQRVALIFSKDFSSYKVEISPSDQPDLNIAILPKGVSVSIQDDGELLIAVPSQGNSMKVADKHISTRMILGNFGDQVVYVDGGELWSVRMT